MHDYTLEDLRRDIFPVVGRMPAYARLMRLLMKDASIGKREKAKIVAGLGYMLSPIDFIPGIIPVVGQLDDILAALIAVRSVLKALSPDKADAYLAQSGLTRAILQGDIDIAKATMVNITATVAKKTGRGIAKLSRYVFRKVSDIAKPVK